METCDEEHLSDDVKTFAHAWNELAKISPHSMHDINVDRQYKLRRDESSTRSPLTSGEHARHRSSDLATFKPTPN